MNNSSLGNVSYSQIDLAGYRIGAPIFASVLTLWITVVNAVLVGILVTSALRHELRYKLIICVSVCDVILNLLYNPFVVEYSVKGAWLHGCVTHVLVQITYNFADTFLELWYLVIIVAESVFRDAWARTVLSRNWSIFVTAIILSTPLICGAIILPSLILTGIRQMYRDMWSSEYCHVLLTAEREVVMSVLCYYLPILTSAGLLGYSAIRFRLQKRNFDIQNRIILDPKNKPENTLLTFLAPWLVVTLLAVPEQIMIILYLTHGFDESTPQISFDAFVTGACFDSLRLGLLPLTWLLIPEVRDAAKTRRQIIEKRYRQFWANVKQGEDASVTYNNLKDDAVM